MNALLLVLVLFPIVGGLLTPVFQFNKKRKYRQIYVASIVIINTILTLITVTLGTLELTVLNLNSRLSLLLRGDEMSRFFVVLVTLLWLGATFYTFEYIKHEGNDQRFFTFFLMTLGIMMGIGFSGNIFTLYLFYEAMTLITFPLVIHGQSPEAMKAGSKYLMYSFFGAAFALVGFVFVYMFSTGGSPNFTPGGVLNMELVAGHENLLMAVYLLSFIGFGAKAGMWPLHAWLPTAHPVAPAPASALLSGVITKAGVLGIIRMTYYQFGVEFLRGTWVQVVLLCLTMFTVFMGSMLAFKEKLFKKRLAFSTVSQVSYVLFGLATMNATGFLGALLHIVFHAVIKNVLFLVAGAIIYQTGKTYVYEFKGIGKSMPITMWCFTIASLALVGIPPTAGVVSKWYLAMGGMESPYLQLGTVGAGVLMISALLTGGYLITVFINAFFPGQDFDYAGLVSQEPSKLMTVPLVIMAAACVLFGMFPNPLIRFIETISAPLF